VIRHVLSDIEKHHCYTGFPQIHFHWQKLENESLRNSFKLTDDRHGILIISTEPMENCTIFSALRRNDILLSLNGIPIADDGTVFFRRGERLLFRYIESTKFVGDEMEACVWRDGGEKKVSFKLQWYPHLVPLHLHDQLPSYYVYAGLVFTYLSRAYLYHEWGKEWQKKGPVEFVESAYYGVRKSMDHQIVIMSQILVDDINNGYQFANLRLNQVNGVNIVNLEQAVQLVEDAEKRGDAFIRFDLDRENVVILDTVEARASTNRILKQNNIASDKSVDLLLLRQHLLQPTETASTTASASSLSLAAPPPSPSPNNSSVVPFTLTVTSSPSPSPLPQQAAAATSSSSAVVVHSASPTPFLIPDKHGHAHAHAQPHLHASASASASAASAAASSASGTSSSPSPSPSTVIISPSPTPFSLPTSGTTLITFPTAAQQ